MSKVSILVDLLKITLYLACGGHQKNHFRLFGGFLVKGVLMNYLTTGQAARICGVQVNTIKGWIQKGSIEAALTPGGHWRIPQQPFIHFLHTWKIPVPKELQVQEEVSRILVVDDDPVIHDLVRGAMDLAPGTCEISSSYDGYSGLVQIGLIRPQLLVLDIMLPKISGLEMIHRLKSSPELSGGMRILVLTGARDNKLIVRKLRDASPEAILFKPVGIQELLQTSCRLLDRPLQETTGETTHAKG